MKPNIFALLTLASLTVAGCATDKTLVPVGGSRADGTVQLAYQFGMFEKPVVNYQQAQNSARERCSAWGYSNAEAFGGQMQQCLAFDAYGSCTRTQVTVTYQCTGANIP